MQKIYFLNSNFLALLAFVVCAMIAGSTNSVSAQGEAQVKVRKTKVVVERTETHSEGDSAEPSANLPVISEEPREREITAKFGGKGQSGTAGCKTDELAKAAIRDLKDDCKAWSQDQKAELKSRFLTSSCNESCEDCGMGLRRCNVTGVVRYILTR